jgi:DNA-binding MarR family transcriptional regulator
VLANVPSRGVVDPLTVRELAAWRGFMRAHARLFLDFGEHLERQHRISMDGYAVLVALDEAGGEKLLMQDLPLEVGTSTGAFVKSVERLAKDGLVTSTPVRSRTRAVELTITDRGRERLDAARVTHRADVRMRFLACATSQEQEILGRFWERVLAA